MQHVLEAFSLSRAMSLPIYLLWIERLSSSGVLGRYGEPI